MPHCHGRWVTAKCRENEGDHMASPFFLREKDQLPTPCLLLDLDAAQANIRKMADYFVGRPCKLRPHAKTHKLPQIARWQLEAGAIGITCGKAQDAVAFAKAGIQRILVANQVVDRMKIEELANLAEWNEITLCLDNEENAVMISDIAEKRGIKLGVLVEVDIGLKRCGLPPGKPTLDFVRKIDDLRGIQFKGLMGYEGALFLVNEEEKQKICLRRLNRLIETKNLLEQSSIEVKEVSSGGSNTYCITGCHPGITDIQPGSYVTMDTWNKQHGQSFDFAVTILTTVISRSGQNKAIIDAGLKAVSIDHDMPQIINDSHIRIEALNEEHGKLILNTPHHDLKVGDRLEIIPSHGCTTIPLYTKYFATIKNRVVAELDLVSGSAVY